MPKNVRDVLSELPDVWRNLTEEQKQIIADMIDGAMVSSYPVCNCCGKPLDEFDIQENFHIHTRVGYGSVHDTEEIDLRLCCNCFDGIVDNCEVSPVVGGE